MTPPALSDTSSWRREWWRASAAIAAIGAFVAWCRVAPAAVHMACHEDGVIENATALLFLAASMALASAARPGSAAIRCGVARAWTIVAALLCAVFAGEEISWGQRLFGFLTPPGITEVNEQNEINLHNLRGIQPLKYSLLVGSIAATIVLCLSTRVLPALGRCSARLGLPVPPLADLAWFGGSLLFLRHVANWLVLERRNDAQEIGELLFAGALLAVALRVWRAPASLFPFGATPSPRDGAVAG